MSQIYIAPTYKCNNRCLMCGVFNAKKDSNKEYGLEEIKNEINKQGVSKGDIAIVSGGEPTIYKYFFEVLNYLEEKGARVIIFSNGRMFKNSDFVEQLNKSKYENMLIPLFGSNSKIHDGFTGRKGSFEDTYQGLLNLDSNGLKYSIKTVAMKNNYEDLPKWAEFISSNFKKPKQVSIHGLHLQGEASKVADKLYVSHKIEAKYIEKALDILLEKGFDVAISAFPLCVIDPYYWKYNMVSDLAEYTAISDDSEKIKHTNNTNYKNKPAICKECSIQSRCEWPWKMYEKIFSLEYLKKF